MSDENNIHTNLEEYKDENNIPTSFEEHKDTPLEAWPEQEQQIAESESPKTEEHKDTPLEAWPEEPQQIAESESSKTEAQRQEGVKKPSSASKAIRLATISKLLEKHTAQMEKVGRMVQP